MATRISKSKLKYARERANATRRAYAISNMGHVMVADSSSKKLMRDHLLGIARIVKPRKRRVKHRKSR
jgi:hypothetical protein